MTSVIFRLFEEAFSCQFGVLESKCNQEAAVVITKYMEKVTARLISHFNCTVGKAQTPLLRFVVQQIHDRGTTTVTTRCL